MKLSVKLALAMSALVAAVVAAAVVSIGAYLRREVERQLISDIDRTADVLEEVQRGRLERLISENRVIGEEPRLKAVMNSAEIDEETVRDTASEMREVARSDLFILLSPDGSVRANVAAEGKAGPAPPKGVVEQVQSADGERRRYAAAWPLEGEVYLVAAHAVMLADRMAGVLVTGDRIDDRLARKIRKETNTEIALFSSGRITAAAIDQHLDAHREELVAQLRDVAQERRSGSFVITVAGQQYITQLGRIIGMESGKRIDRVASDGASTNPAFFVMLRSLDEALATYRQIRKDLVLLGMLSFFIAILAAVVLASTLTRRVGRLAHATALVAAGELETAVPVGGRDEIGALARSFNDMIAKLRISREELRNKERLEREMEIATVIQTLLLPAQPILDGFDVAARMLPAEEVGGDFYDLHHSHRGSWVAIGDVSGHGVTSGLIMMMVQSMLAAISKQPSERAAYDTPKEVLRIINAALYENLRVRMRDDNYMTMVLFKHLGGGLFRYAGAHESILIYRAGSRHVDVLPTDGTWLGMQEDIGPFLEEREVELMPGDVMLLYTDGVTEAKNPHNVQYNLEHLRGALIRHASAPMPSAQKIRDGVIDDVISWARVRQDDVTVVVLRRIEIDYHIEVPA